jgi:hypothetical protein
LNFTNSFIADPHRARPIAAAAVAHNLQRPPWGSNGTPVDNLTWRAPAVCQIAVAAIEFGAMSSHPDGERRRVRRGCV